MKVAKLFPGQGVPIDLLINNVKFTLTKLSIKVTNVKTNRELSLQYARNFYSRFEYHVEEVINNSEVRVLVTNKVIGIPDLKIKINFTLSFPRGFFPVNPYTLFDILNKFNLYTEFKTITNKDIITRIENVNINKHNNFRKIAIAIDRIRLKKRIKQHYEQTANRNRGYFDWA